MALSEKTKTCKITPPKRKKKGPSSTKIKKKTYE